MILWWLLKLFLWNLIITEVDDVKALGCAELPEDPSVALELVLLPVPVKELRLAALPSRLLAATPRDVAAANWLLGS